MVAGGEIIAAAPGVKQPFLDLLTAVNAAQAESELAARPCMPDPPKKRWRRRRGAAMLLRNCQIVPKTG